MGGQPGQKKQTWEEPEGSPARGGRAWGCAEGPRAPTSGEADPLRACSGASLNPGRHRPEQPSAWEGGADRLKRKEGGAGERHGQGLVDEGKRYMMKTEEPSGQSD